jgi:hypothetical protein
MAYKADLKTRNRGRYMLHVPTSTLRRRTVFEYVGTVAEDCENLTNKVPHIPQPEPLVHG